MFRGIEVVTIAVSDINAAVAQYELVLDTPVSTRGESGTMKTAFFDLADSSIELVQDDNPESPVGRFMARSGGGVYYLGMKSDAPTDEVARLRSASVRLVGDPGPQQPVTTQAFVHPGAAASVLLRIVPVGYRPRPES